MQAMDFKPAQSANKSAKSGTEKSAEKADAQQFSKELEAAQGKASEAGASGGGGAGGGSPAGSVGEASQNGADGGKLEANNSSKSAKSSGASGEASEVAKMSAAGGAAGGAGGAVEKVPAGEKLSANALFKKGLKNPKIALSAAALVAVAKKLPASSGELEFFDLKSALKISELADKKELAAALEKLNKILTAVVKKLDVAIKNTAAAAAKEASPLAALLGAKGGTAGKIKDLIAEAEATNALLPKRLQISKGELLEIIKTELRERPDYGAELLDDVQFTKLLDLAQTLKSQGAAPDLSRLFKLPIAAAAAEQIKTAAAEAQNVKQLLNELKTELNISELTAERVAADDYNPAVFKQKFPKLYEQNFFAAAVDHAGKKSAAKAAPKASLAALLRAGEGADNELAKRALGAANIDTSALKGGKLAELLRGANDAIAAATGGPAAAAAADESAQNAAPRAFAGDLKQAFLAEPGKLSKPQTAAVLQNFAQDFKDELAKFKAPLTRVSIALKPAELGEINVTMMARGQNLQVNLHSANAATMGIFVQNQAELRSALVNMGFTGLAMNFSSGEGGQNSGQQGGGRSRKGAGGGGSAGDDELAEDAAELSMTLERYLV